MKKIPVVKIEAPTIRDAYVFWGGTTPKDGTPPSGEGPAYFNPEEHDNPPVVR